MEHELFADEINTNSIEAAKKLLHTSLACQERLALK